MQKICTRCNQGKPETAFGPDKRTKSGLKAVCRQCDREIHRLLYLATRDTQQGVEYRKRATESSMARFAEKKARGECYFCDNPAAKGFIRCQDHIEYSRAAIKRSRRSMRSGVLEAYGGKCRCCGETNYFFLTLDHVNSDGAEHRRSIGGGRRSGDKIYRWAVRHGYPDSLQLLCYNCNCGRARNGGICPHQQPASPETSSAS